MSDREMYCDREPYDRDSSDILFWLSEDSIKSDIELEYFDYYKKLTSKLHFSKFLIRHYEEKLNKETHHNMREYYQLKINIELSNIEIQKELLSKLELTTPIENILQRERKPNETITLLHLNRELPNIPYNVLSSHSNFFLSNEEITLIKEIIDEKEAENTKIKLYVKHLTKQQEDNTKSDALSFKDMIPYILLALILILILFYSKGGI